MTYPRESGGFLLFCMCFARGKTPRAKYAYVRAQKCLVFVLGDKHTFMQIFALTLFNVFWLAMIYQTAIFPGFSGSLVEREWQSGCCGLRNVRSACPGCEFDRPQHSPDN